MFEFRGKKHLDEKALGIESTRYKSPLRLLKLLAIIAFGVSTKISPEKRCQLCDRLKTFSTKERSWFYF